MHHEFIPRGVCSRKIAFDVEDGKVKNTVFTGGCDGNLKAIGKLIENMDAKTVADILEGNTCRAKGTSCADRLAKALREALAEEA